MSNPFHDTTSGRRRSRARRSRSVMPPQTPNSTLLSSASARHSVRTGQPKQTTFARFCAAPCTNSASGSPFRHDASAGQSSAQSVASSLADRLIPIPPTRVGVPSTRLTVSDRTNRTGRPTEPVGTIFELVRTGYVPSSRTTTRSTSVTPGSLAHSFSRPQEGFSGAGRTLSTVTRSPHHPPDRIRTLAQLLGFCALAGLLVAGIALPLVGGLGLAAKATA